MQVKNPQTRATKVNSEHHKVSESSSANAQRMRATNLPCHRPQRESAKPKFSGSQVVNLSPIEYSWHRKHASINETVILFMLLGPAYLDGTDLACSLKPNSFLYHYKFGDLKTRPSGKRRGPTREVRQVLGLPFYAPHCAQYRYQNSRMQYAFHGRHMR